MTDAGRWRPLATAVVLLAVVAAGMRLVRMWTASRYGLDFSDEGYYLAWIDNPFAYKESATQFGFFYHPLYEYLGRDVVRLRQANILITVGLAWCLCMAVIRLPGLYPDSTQRPMRRWSVALACLFATSYPNLFDMWLPTPSYNSLAMQAALVTATGLLLTGKDLSTRAVLGAVLIGVGGAMAFLAKPTTAAAFGMLTLLYWLVAGHFNWRTAAVALLVAFALLAASAIAIDGSLAGFHQRLVGALDSARLMGIQPSMGQLLRIDRFKFSGWDWGVLSVLTATLLVCLFALGERHVRWRLPALGLLSGLVLLCLALAAGWFKPAIEHAKFRGLLMLSLPAAAGIAAVLLVRTRWASSFSWPRQALAVAITFAIVPHAYAFGTGNNYWQSASAVSVFWVLGGVAVLIPAMGQTLVWLRLLPLAVGAQLLAMFLTQMALSHPYRHPQASAHPPQESVLGPGGSRLYLDAGYARYVESLRRVALAGGLRVGDPVIDLTGHSPGSLFAIGARILGSPWLLGGYPGSDKSAASILAGVSCPEMARAWVLVEPDGPRHLSPSVLEKAGLKVSEDYQVAGSFVTPDGFGSYATGAVQRLLKPVRPIDAATRNCLIARGVAP